MQIQNIKRDPKCETSATLEEKLKFFERVRITGKELCEEKEWHNAKNLYSRCIGLFKNMPKKQKDSLSPEQQLEREEILTILNLNVALCLLRKNMAPECIKHCQEAIKISPKNPKGYYRLCQAYKMVNDLDRAKENLLKAIELQPSDKVMRDEYKKLCAEKTSKEKEWYAAMSGFYNKDKIKLMEVKDEEDKLLR